MEKNRWNIPITWNDFRKVWLMTKFVIIFLFMMSMNVSANLYSQTKTVSIKMERGSLEEIIQVLKRQTEYGFFYNIDNEAIKNVKNISIDMTDVRLEDVLQQILKGTNLTYSIINDVVIINSKIQKTIKDSVQENLLIGKVCG